MKHALIAGVPGYRDRRITPLRYAADDARALGAQLLKQCRFDRVTVLAGPDSDGEPTLDAILDRLEAACQRVQKGDLFLFSFSGHGIELEGEGYLFAADSNPSYPKIKSLPLSELRRVLGHFEARWKVLLLDACRDNPNAAKGAESNVMGETFSRNLVRAIQDGSGVGRATALLSACHPGQRAWESETFGHGVMSHYILDGIEGAAWRDGRLTLRQLARHAEEQVERWCRTTPGLGSPQKPWFEQFGAEEIVIGEDSIEEAAAAAELRAKEASKKAQQVETALVSAEERLRQLQGEDEVARRFENDAAANRIRLAREAEEKAAHAAAIHEKRMAELRRQIEVLESRLGYADRSNVGDVGSLDALVALLDEQDRLAELRRQEEAAAAVEKQRRDEEERLDAERRAREQREREAEIARLKVIEAERRKAQFGGNLAKYQRIYASQLPAEAKRQAWLDFCRREGVTPSGEHPRNLIWTEHGAIEQLPSWIDRATMEEPYVNTLGMRFVPVPGTQVLFSIWMTRVQDYEAYAKAVKGVDDSWRKPGFEQQLSHPVVGVSWEDSQGFCRWLTEEERKTERIGSDEHYRLPTDSEWSVAVGLPVETGDTPAERDCADREQFPWGKGWPPPAGAGNYCDETYRRLGGTGAIISGYDDGFQHTSPVGSFRPSADGLYDLGGNASEWCEDFYDGDRRHRVSRGGSWFVDDMLAILSSRRRPREQNFRSDYCGFRVVLSRSIAR